MSDFIAKHILISGLPGSGKTSFLGAFIHCVGAGDAKQKDFFQYKYGTNTEYLNSIHNDWLNCKVPERTFTNLLDKKVEMFLEDFVSKERVTLSVPDIAGEVFSEQFKSRYWDLSYKENLSNIEAIMLFIHPDKVIAHSLIDDVVPLMHEFDDGTSPEKVPFDVKKIPTQVVLVEIIQFHLEYLPILTIPIVLAISAWDSVKASLPELTPNEWIEINLPLLYQFLIANNERITFNIYGISAQGGNFEDPTAVEKLRQLDNPEERIIVQTGTTVDKKISKPVQWIMEQWQK